MFLQTEMIPHENRAAEESLFQTHERVVDLIRELCRCARAILREWKRCGQRGECGCHPHSGQERCPLDRVARFLRAQPRCRRLRANWAACWRLRREKQRCVRGARERSTGRKTVENSFELESHA